MNTTKARIFRSYNVSKAPNQSDNSNSFQIQASMKIIRQTECNGQQKAAISERWIDEYPEKPACHSVVDFKNYPNKLIEQNHYWLADKNVEQAK